MLKKYLPVRPSKTRCLLLVGLMLFICILDNLPISSLIDFTVYSDIIKPLLWLGLAGVVWIFPKARYKAPLRLKGSINWWAFNFAFINIIILVFAGFIDGFGKSPYDQSPKGLIINVLVIGAVLFGREAVRSYTVNSLTNDENYLLFIPIALFMTISNYTLNRFNSINGYEGIVEFIAQFMAPEFSQNFLATYLAFLGGWFPAFIYLGILQAFHWFSPVLPDLKWITTALVGIMCPVFSLMVMQNVYINKIKKIKIKDKPKESTVGWMITSILSIAIIWFAVGVFPIYPSVIATGSMEPMIKPGDVILIQKIDGTTVKVGDVIQFQRDNILISHRIIEVLEVDEAKAYRTKGDNNSSPDDDFVKPEQIMGRILQVVPKIGWPTLLIKSKKDIPLDRIEF